MTGPLTFETDAGTGLSRPLIWTMSVGAALSVANLYYIQPVLASLSDEFHVSAQTAGSLATVTQVGYAIGMLLVVPLGDIVEKRKLILIMLGLVACALSATAASPSLPWMFAACLATGVTTVTPQLLIPLAAHLAAPHERGQVVGTVMSGLLVGILLARTFSGVVAEHFGWRVMYLLAAALTLLLLAALRIALPRSEPLNSHLSYGALISSLAQLLRREPVLRNSSFYGAMAFGSFSGFWTVLPFFVSQPPYNYGSAAVGLFALIGVTGILVAPIAGRLADRGLSRRIIGFGLSLMLGSYVLLMFTATHVVMLVLGLILLDMGITANQIANQSRIYSLQPEERNRLNTIYMFLYFVGGAAGSLAGVFGWTHGGWTGFCATASVFLLAGLAVYSASREKATR